MEQNFVNREKFWDNGGKVSEEAERCFKKGRIEGDGEFSLLDQFLTLICC